MSIDARRHDRDWHEFRRHGVPLKSNAKELRANMTDTEHKLWSRLRSAQTGHRFRRQHPINAYIVDFICIKQKLIIELDGGQHNESAAFAYDTARTATLEKLGYRVLRFWNNDVMENLEGVYVVILETLKNSPNTPKP